MGDVLRTVHRLRKAEERRARARLAEAEAAFRRSQSLLQETEQTMAESWSRANVSDARIMAMQAHHHDVLRLEMKRRVAERHAAHDEEGAGVARAAFAVSALDTKVVELVADARDRDAFVADERRLRSALDEQGLQSWWRRTA